MSKQIKKVQKILASAIYKKSKRCMLDAESPLDGVGGYLKTERGARRLSGANAVARVFFVWCQLEKAMTHRGKRDNRNGATRMDPENELTEREAAEYADSVHGFHMPVSKLQRSRIGLCSGPKYFKIDGWGVRYTPQFIDEYIQSRRSHVMDPADRIVAA